MLLGARKHTAGDRKRWRIDYYGRRRGDDIVAVPPLEEGVTVTSATVTLADTTTAPLVGATIDTVSVEADGKVVFWTNGGVVNELFTASVAMMDSIAEIRKDTISFAVVSP